MIPELKTENDPGFQNSENVKTENDPGFQNSENVKKESDPSTVDARYLQRFHRI